MAEPADEDRPRLDDAEVCERLDRLDELLGQVEAIPGPTGELALDAVSALADVYGEATLRLSVSGCSSAGVEDAVGGSQVWPAIERFFAELDRRPGSPLRAARI